LSDPSAVAFSAEVCSPVEFVAKVDSIELSDPSVVAFSVGVFSRCLWCRSFLGLSSAPAAITSTASVSSADWKSAAAMAAIIKARRNIIATP